MSKPFDMELFLAAVLTGSYATRQRHLRQAKLIQAEISERWQLETPWSWKKKHIAWFIDHRLARRCKAMQGDSILLPADLAATGSPFRKSMGLQVLRRSDFSGRPTTANPKLLSAKGR
nr:hypothetical protein [Pseudomonas aeruginosa]